MWCVCVSRCFYRLVSEKCFWVYSKFGRWYRNGTVTWEQIDSSQGCFISFHFNSAIPFRRKTPMKLSTFWKGQPDDAMVRDVPHVESIPHWIVGEFEQSHSLELEHGKVGASQILKNDVCPMFLSYPWSWGRSTHTVIVESKASAGQLLGGSPKMLSMTTPFSFERCTRPSHADDWTNDVCGHERHTSVPATCVAPDIIWVWLARVQNLTRTGTLRNFKLWGLWEASPNLENKH